MKRLSIYLLAAGMAVMSSSCSDFLDTVPKDQLAPSTAWQTESDARGFIVACYRGLLDGNALLYLDCGSDIGYNNFPWEGYRPWGDGSLSSSNTGASFYSYTSIRRANTFLENVDQVTFSNEAVKNDYVAQAKAIRAYRYFVMNWNYGGVPIIDSYTSADEARVKRNSEQEVREYIAKDLNEALAGIADVPAARGFMAKGAVLALQMREALYYGDWQKAKDAAKAIIDLKQYELDADYTNLFKLSGVDSKEIILADQHIENTHGLGTIGQMYNNAEGGWSSIVPTQNLVDMYEMSDGLTKEESSLYDAKHPFANRDPRMAMTILYPGRDFRGSVINTLDKILADGSENKNFPTYTDNASKTALSWAKYLDPMEQYGNIWSSGACPIVFRYAEVLLSYAEAANELNGPSDDIYGYLNQVRQRAGMPAVDRAKYATKDKLRELIHRERTVELAGEGLRRADIIRWKENGKMLAEKVMNGNLLRIEGTVDEAEVDPGTRATVTSTAVIENRSFTSRNRYLPIPQGSIDKNPNLEQNPGY
ncbi:RagB/SusD family nutrient uptake outer membrane protein [Parabacteroides distasonis]|uniref:RagB/SusD family nutrient uptake outer membrane protein n=1 Tax=Parabacteroides distasonis TaxID=823 RepID=A0A3L7ZQR0_PARDI|nr:RagB/SusD family nutrient uptake outer membrane protein [Parabacteroides distasonis]RLT74088.1 RagB/SusD family nutrient uptake outer membrane protein [Parabacteroides distasonis]